MSAPFQFLGLAEVRSGRHLCHAKNVVHELGCELEEGVVWSHNRLGVSSNVLVLEKQRLQCWCRPVASGAGVLLHPHRLLFRHQ